MANPILPLWECIPDGEPKQFGDRVYLYGSHDRIGTDQFYEKRFVFLFPAAAGCDGENGF